MLRGAAMPAVRRLAVLWLAALAFSLAGLSAPEAQNRRAEPKAALAAQRPGVVDAYILAFGLWGPESVFESEATRAAAILARQLGGEGRAIVRFNSKRRSGARPAALRQAVGQVARALDPEEDVVVMLLTSHGTREGIGLAAGRQRLLVTPEDVGRLLGESGARHRVLIVSACYSGIFAEALADERTLVITAASSDRPSFGCEDGRTWTYFGEAFFDQALRAEPRLDAAFARARELVTAREEAEGFEPSRPQIAGGKRVLERLAR
jgi:hypothetical protein